MKTLPTLAAVAIALALVFTPMIASAAGSITFSSPASGASYSGSTSYSIAGTVSPVPTQADNVAITVKNPAGAVVDTGNAAVSLTNGAFSYATAVGNPVNPSTWPTGTYTISASDSLGATPATTTFTYTAQTVAQFNQTKWILDIARNQTIIENQIAKLQTDLKGNFTATSTALSALSTAVGTLTTNLATLTTNVGSISTAVNNLQSSLTSLTNSVSSINTAVGNLGTQVTAAANSAKSASDAVSSTQTYVLVVAVLVAITLVLELAIMIRKLS